MPLIVRHSPGVGSKTESVSSVPVGTGREVKLNAAYAEDGPELLVRTIEFNTGDTPIEEALRTVG